MIYSFSSLKLASAHNFADDNTLSAFANTVTELIHILQAESEKVIEWFQKKQNDCKS